MIEITEFIKEYMAALDQAFPDRVWFAGLQGSYGRGEATEASDIDMVVILDQLSVSDIRTYDLPGAYLRLPVRKAGAGKLGALGAFPVLPRHHPHKRKPGPGALLRHQSRYSPGHKVRRLRRLPRLRPQYAV